MFAAPRVPFGFTDGDLPESGLTQGTDATSVARHRRIVFEVTPGRSMTVLYAFTNDDDGGSPKTPFPEDFVLAGRLHPGTFTTQLHTRKRSEK
jgi:hypothetical protein